MFAVVLLTLGAGSVSLFQFAQQQSSAGITPFGAFVWGLDSIDFVLAVWLAARKGIWVSWQGWLRGLGYLTAYAFGRMFFSSTQDWWVNADDTWRLPGSKAEDYARPAIDLLMLLMSTWLVTPLAILVRLRLSADDQNSGTIKRLSISNLMVLMTVAALSLAWVRFLTTEFAPSTYYRHLTQVAAIKLWIGEYLPQLLPPLLAIFLVAYGLTKNGWQMVFIFALAFLIDVIGTRSIESIQQALHGVRGTGILSGNLRDALLYIGGRTSIHIIALTGAATLGVRPMFGGITGVQQEDFRSLS